MSGPSRDWARLIRDLLEFQPSFLWAPWDHDSAHIDLARGAACTSDSLSAGAGGIMSRNGNDAKYIEFATSFSSFSTHASNWIGVGLASAPSPSLMTGAFLKVGTGGSSGLGFGAGSSSFENSSSRMVLLREGVAWTTSATNAWVPGANRVNFGRTSSTAFVCHNIETGIEAGVSIADSTAYSNTNVRIGGYTTLRGFNGGAHIIAIYEWALNNTDFTAARSVLSGLLAPLSGMSGDDVRRYAAKRIWVPVSAGGGAYSLTAESGSYALTGQAAGLLASRALAAEQGSYALTGQGVALNRGYVVAAEQGSYALTGQDAGLLRGLLLTAAQGSYALSGQDVTLTYTPLGAYSLTADQGSYDLTGQSVSLLWGRALVAEQGSYALNGQDASLVYTPAGAYSLAAGQGAYALTGQDVALLWSKVLAAAQGSYTITGQDATLSRGIVLTAAQGSYTLTGQDAAFARAYALSAGYGSYALTGQIVSLTYSGAALEALEYLLLISHITQSMSKTSKVTMEIDLISRIK